MYSGMALDSMIPQARGNLELMMERQLELRREETKAIHSYVLISPPHD